jgi:excisionase family DNA binding protein
MVQPEWLAPKQAAVYIGVSPKTLENWRSHKRRVTDGPPFSRVSGRLVRYRRSDLDAWMERNKVEGAA